MALEPPAVTRDPALTARLEAALADKGSDYVPRTELKGTDGAPKYVNRLILEASPYLLQHAHNPVDWRAWSPETLAEAEAAGKPIFLSVGYATCHWCHVMEEESFDDEEVAALINEHFIPIKIDREQRPDLDQIYITATQLQQGHAGWPNSVFLKPSGQPFHTGTYFPKPQFMQVLEAVARAWNDPEKRTEIDRVAERLSAAIQRQQAARMAETAPPGPEVFEGAVAQLAEIHNSRDGGFSDSQQFPQEGFLLFLLDHWRRTGEDHALEIATRTLDAIAAGGIHDHVGGGFHRYTVDRNWRTPHFEKMLYNQGLLGRAMVEGWEATHAPAYARAAKRAFDYVLREMTEPGGAFYSAEDADSLTEDGAREEGAFYVWTPERFAAALGPEAAERWGPVLGMDQAPTLEGQHVLHLTPGAAVYFDALDPVLETLRAARADRPRPLRDEKVIAGWNGLMIRALAEGGRAFDAPAYTQAAAQAGEVLWTRLWDGTELARIWADGAAREAGQLDDYAWLGLGYLALYEATGATLWRDRAGALARAAVALFGDEAGRLKMAAADGPIGPVYDSADGATPAGESSALELLVRIGAASGDKALTIRAEELRAAISAQLTRAPLLRPEAAMASRILDSGPSGMRRLLAQGTVRAHLSPAAPDWEMRLEIAPGWHLNAADPGPDWLVGAQLEGGGADWPAGETQSFGFAEEGVRVYDGSLAVPVTAEAGAITLHLQACTDSFCLNPVSATFRLP